MFEHVEVHCQAKDIDEVLLGSLYEACFRCTLKAQDFFQFLEEGNLVKLFLQPLNRESYLHHISFPVIGPGCSSWVDGESVEMDAAHFTVSYIQIHMHS